MNLFRRWQLWLGLGVSAVFLWLALSGLHLQAVADALQHGNYAWLVPSVAIYFVAVWVRTWRWDYLLRPLKRISLRRLFPVVVIGYMGNNIYPARIGELVRAYVLKRNESVSMSASLATIVVERIFDGLVMLLFVVVALPSVPSLPDWLRSVVLIGSAVFLSALLVFLFLAARPARALRLYDAWLSRLIPRRYRERLRGLLQRFLTGLAALHNFRDVLIIFGISILIWLLETVKYWFVMHTFNLEVSFFALMLMNGVVNLATTIPAAPGYVGTFDTPGIAVLTVFGVDRVIATAYTLVLHAALWLPITLLGFYYMVRLSLHWGDLAKAAQIKDVEAAA